MRVGFATWTKNRLCIADALAVQRFAFAASQSRSIITRIALTREIVRTLCERSSWFSLFFYKRIIAAFRFRPEERLRQVDIDDVERQVLIFCSDIGSRCGKLPYEVMCGMTFDEAQLFYKHLILRYLESAMSNAMSSTPMPDYVKQLSEKIQKTQREINAVSSRPKALEQYRLRDFFPRFA